MMNSVDLMTSPAGADGSRERIIAAARKHFLTHGFRSVTTDDLASELGMSKKTLYKHFRSKNELLEEIVRVKFAGLEAKLQALVSEKLECDEVVNRALLLAQEEASEVHPAFMRDVRRELPALFQFVQYRRRELISKYVSEMLQEGRRSGKVRKDYPVPVLIEVLMGMFDAIVTPAKLEELDLAPREGIRLIASIFRDGVLSAKEGKSSK